MASYPTCVRCHGTESELDVDGVCTTCHSRGSGRETPGHGRPRLVPPTKTVLDEDTRTIPPDEVNGTGTATLDPSRPFPPPVLPPNVRFTHYTDLQFIDRGGMGLVYKAVQTNANRIVALKIMNPIAQSDSRQEKRFKTEAEALARLSHPGIVQIYDVGHENGVAYFSMEYIPGGPLSKRIKAGPKLSPRDAAELMASVSSAIAAAHAVGVVHRDVKPSNILLNDIGKPKVTDFGLAALADSTARMTNTGALLGTPSYMSPEQASGRYDDVGPRSDVYSLGATLYELLTGKPPFVADTPVATAMKVCNERLVRPRDIEPKVPVDLEGICLKCLEKNPVDRYSSAAGLANDLSRYLRGEPVRPLSGLQKAVRWTKRHKLATAAALLVALAGILLFALLPGDAKAEIERDLRRGKPVTLVGEKGWPKYSRFAYGDETPSVRDKGDGDGAAHFSTRDTSYLELCERPIAERFTVTAQIQHEAELTAFFGQVGLYLELPEGEKIHRFITAQFSDFRIAPPEAKTEYFPRAEFTESICIFFPKYDVIGTQYLARSIVYPPTTALEKPWRTVSFHVDPNGATAIFADMEPDVKEGKTIHERTATKDTFHANGRVWRQAIDTKTEAVGSPFPQWSPQCRVGIYARHSTVAFRNVVLTPIPSP